MIYLYIAISLISVCSTISASMFCMRHECQVHLINFILSSKFNSFLLHNHSQEFPFPNSREGGIPVTRLGSILCDHNVIGRQLLCSLDDRIISNVRSSAELRYFHSVWIDN